MTYPYAVKYNGKWYRPGEDVPDNQAKEKPVEVNVLLDGREIQPVISQVEEVQPEIADHSEMAVENVPNRRGRKKNN